MYYAHKLVAVKISEKQAKSFIAEARINMPGELDVYEHGRSRGILYRIFTLLVPEDWDNDDPDELLEYARQNMPDGLTFEEVVV